MTVLVCFPLKTGETEMTVKKYLLALLATLGFILYNLRFQIFTRSTTNTNERYIDIDPKTLCRVSGDLLPFIRLENSHQVGKRLIYIVMYYCSIIMVVHFVGIEKLKDSLQTCKIISLPKDMLWQTFFMKVFPGIIGISLLSWIPMHRKTDLPLSVWNSK